MHIRVETKYDFDLIKKDREFSDAYDKYLAPIRKEQSEIFAKKTLLSQLMICKKTKHEID